MRLLVKRPRELDLASWRSFSHPLLPSHTLLSFFLFLSLSALTRTPAPFSCVCHTVYFTTRKQAEAERKCRTPGTFLLVPSFPKFPAFCSLWRAYCLWCSQQCSCWLRSQPERKLKTLTSVRSFFSSSSLELPSRMPLPPAFPSPARGLVFRNRPENDDRMMVASARRRRTVVTYTACATCARTRERHVG